MARTNLKVYYNSACPVCNAGINKQKTKMHDCDVDWLDVHSNNQLASELGVALEIVREKLHVIDVKGKKYVGFDAFLAIWQASPDEHWKYVMLNLPLIKPTCRLVYNLFAAKLYAWNKSERRW
jgi:predicted DCC family thiol-disulfide oxidoreductase YuxK